MSRLRFLADHDLNEHIVTGVKRLNPRIEFIRVRDVGLEAASDHEVLAYAFRDSLCVVSHDVNTMTSAAAATIAAGQQFPGLFLVRQTTPVRAAIETILLAWSASEHDEWRNQVVFLPF
jgi:predicted nuclease of predicted toxin-antitoxin system